MNAKLDKLDSPVWTAYVPVELRSILLTWTDFDSSRENLSHAW